jgi:hypothetical protein
VEVIKKWSSLFNERRLKSGRLYLMKEDEDKEKAEEGQVQL